ncbi:MAG: hypothetical protein Q9M89_08125 [Persephonella sp.]|nr:hypothetical protein [Persephonella sp.]
MLNALVIHAIKQHLIENRETFKEELEHQLKALYSKQKQNQI